MCGPRSGWFFKGAYRLGGSLIRAPEHDEELSTLLLMHAGDLVLLPTNELHLESALEVLVTIATTWGMKFNYGMTKTLLLLRELPLPLPLKYLPPSSPSPPDLPPPLTISTPSLPL